jgi:lysophospholipase L1-like esterase
VGDSVPYGTTYVDQKAIFSEQVVSMMERRHVTVMNAASPGWAPSNEFEFVKARGIYNADLVVFVYNTSDLAQPFSSYRPSPNTPLQNPPSAIVELWSRYIKPRIINTAAMIDNGSTASEDIPSGAATGMVLATISATRTYVQSQGAKFAILYSPSFTPGLEKRRAEWDRALNGLRRWVSAHDVPFLDMSTVIKPEKVPSLYFDRIHLRPSGDRLMAQNFVGWFDTLPR